MSTIAITETLGTIVTEHPDLARETRAARTRLLLRGSAATPGDGCASYDALLRGLAEIEADTHLHVHKENNLLFPAVLERERQCSDAGGTRPG